MNLAVPVALWFAAQAVWAQGSRTWSELGAESRYPPRIGQMRFTISITGNVALADGSTDELMLVQVYCSRLAGSANADARGRFRLECGTNAAVVEGVVTGAAVHVRYPGFDAPAVGLAAFHNAIASNAPIDVGTVTLHPTEPANGRTVSLRMLAAPAAARRSFDDAMKKITLGKTKEARKDLEAAIAVYPEFADAWMELGRLQGTGGDSDAARSSFRRAIEAEPRYLRPHLQLAMLELSLARWNELLEVTGRLLRLDPIHYPQAHFFQAVGYYGLHDRKRAEDSAREAERLDKGNQFPKVLSLLAAILTERGQTEEATAYRERYFRLTGER
jgi:tetratricopeptide (TPR) repeat protein